MERDGVRVFKLQGNKQDMVVFLHIPLLIHIRRARQVSSCHTMAGSPGVETQPNKFRVGPKKNEYI
jgi:hypothetical protein